MANNTNIIIQDGTSIYSKDGWIYGICTQPWQFSTVSHVYLIAMKEDYRDGSKNITDKITILDLRGSSSLLEINKLINKACSVLQSLFEAIERGDRVWDVAEQNSDT